MPDLRSLLRLETAICGSEIGKLQFLNTSNILSDCYILHSANSVVIIWLSEIAIIILTLESNEYCLRLR
jgi:hypothetical protein